MLVHQIMIRAMMHIQGDPWGLPGKTVGLTSFQRVSRGMLVLKCRPSTAFRMLIVAGEDILLRLWQGERGEPRRATGMSDQSL
jgi:hypothetical protein